MAHDPHLEARIDLLSAHWPGFAKKRMLGGMGWLVRGNMAFGIWKDSLVVRCGTQAYAAALARPHVAEFDVTGRPMAGWVLVAPDGLDDDPALLDWLAAGRDCAAALPDKGG